MSEVESFITIVKGFQPSAIVATSSVLDISGVTTYASDLVSAFLGAATHIFSYTPWYRISTGIYSQFYFVLPSSNKF